MGSEMCIRDRSSNRLRKESVLVWAVVLLVYPWLFLSDHEIGFRHMVNSLTQNESPCSMPRCKQIGPILFFPFSVVTSRVIFHFFNNGLDLLVIRDALGTVQAICVILNHR